MSDIHPLQLPGIQQRLADLNRKGQERLRRQAGLAPLESLSSEKLAQGLDEHAPYIPEGEISKLHIPFEKWLRLNSDRLQWIHCRPDMPTTTACGVPDFTVIGSCFTCFVEFKNRSEPEKWKSREAKQKQWAENARARGIPYLCTNDLQTAVQFTKQLLEKI